MGRRVLATAIALLLPACLDWSSLYDDGGGKGGDQVASELGCSDGTREALPAYPRIAACGGAWSVPGIVDPTPPACGRAAGNNGRRSDGAGCAASDLCADGWHVCGDYDDLERHDGADACFDLDLDNAIYVTRQRADPFTIECVAGNSALADDVYGCGGIGYAIDDCYPFGRVLSLPSDCVSPFDCGNLFEEEGRYVTKRSAERGGVLCCRD